MVPKKIPKLTPEHKEDRVKWCQDLNNTRWTQWVFSDESRFELFRLKRGRWSKKRPEIGAPKFGPSLMVWGAISNRGKSILVVIHGTANSEKYQTILKEAEPSLRDLYPRGFTFMQNNPMCHTSSSTTAWLSSRDWRVSSWPANSPDLNPIENVWGLMKDAVEKKKPKTAVELEVIVREVWDNLSLPYCKTLIRSMPSRIQQCITLKGEKTRY